MADRIVKVVLRGEVSNLVGNFTAAGKVVADTGKKMTGAAREAEQFRKGLDSVGASAGRLGLVAGAALGAVVVATANFESAMSKVGAATHESAENMALLREEAIKAGAATVFSATEAADAITALSKAGVSTNDILKGGLNGSLALASAGELDVASAADIAATAMNQFGLAGADIPHIADLLAAGAGKAQGEVTDFAQALKYVGPVAHQMGISIEETTGTIAELAAQGILADQAGTSLRGLLTSLSSPSKMAADQIEALGLQLYDARGNFVGFNGVAGQLQASLGKLTSAERDQTLGRLFGNEQITAARILYAGGAADVDKWTKAVNDQGYAAETASIKLDNLKGDVEQFTGSLETALIGTGSGSQGPIRDIVQGATDIVNAYNDMPAAVHNGTSSLLTVTAVSGIAVFAFSKIIRSVSDTRVALDQLGPAGVRAGRLLKTGLAVGAIVGGLDLIGNAIDSVFDKNLDETNLGRSLDALANGTVTGEIRDKFGADMEGLKRQLEQATSDGVDGLFRGIVNHSGPLQPFLNNPFDTDGVGFDTATDNIKSLDQQLASMVESGNAEKAKLLVDQFIKAGASSEQVAKGFDQYTIALENLDDQLDPTTTFSYSLNDAMKTTTAILTGDLPAGYRVAGGVLQAFAGDTEAAAKASEDAAKKLQEQADKIGDSFSGLGDDLDNSKVSLNQWVADLQKQATALDNFTKNAAEARRRKLNPNLVRSLLDEGPAGALRLDELAHATDAQIREANRAFAAQRREVRELKDYIIRTFGEIPPAPVNVRTQTALDQVKVLTDAIKTLGISLLNLPPLPSALGVPIGGRPGGGRDGDPNTPYFNGGYTGNLPVTAPAGVVHGREFVFSAAATQGNESYLESLHRSLRGYSGGGYVQPSTSVMSVGIDYQRLTRAVLAARPERGDTHVYGDGAYRRELAQDRARASRDGIRR